MSRCQCHGAPVSLQVTDSAANSERHQRRDQPEATQSQLLEILLLMTQMILILLGIRRSGLRLDRSNAARS
jgi:hypothetical protein